MKKFRVQTIDEILTELDQIILRARNERDRIGFFATRSVRNSMFIEPTLSLLTSMLGMYIMPSMERG